MPAQFRLADCGDALGCGPAPPALCGANSQHAKEARVLEGLANLANPAFAASAKAPEAYVSGGKLIIHGCRENEEVNVRAHNGGVLLTHTVNGTPNQDSRGKSEVNKLFTGVKEIVFLAYDGHNKFHNNTGLPSQVLGGQHRDEFNGSEAATTDWFFGLAGNDVLRGGNGSDHLFGRTGNDVWNADQYTDDAVYRPGSLTKVSDQKLRSLLQWNEGALVDLVHACPPSWLV